MIPKYKLSRKAEKDIEGIWRYTLVTWSLEQADRYIKGLFEACDRIAECPSLMGRSYEHVRVGYRKYLYGKHVIFYQIQSSGDVLISRILHERMDFDRHL